MCSDRHKGKCTLLVLLGALAVGLLSLVVLLQQTVEFDPATPQHKPTPPRDLPRPPATSRDLMRSPAISQVAFDPDAPDYLERCAGGITRQYTSTLYVQLAIQARFRSR